MNKKGRKLQKLGGAAALYEAGAFLAAIIFFLLVVDYPSITNQLDKIELIAKYEVLFTLMYLVSYVLFGFTLVILSLALHEKLKKSDSSLLNVATAFGIIWATLLIGSGMIFNSGIKVAVELYVTDPAQAVTVFTSVEAVSLGLGFAYGEIIGGLWILLISIIALRANIFNKGLNYFGIVIGVVGIISIITILNDIAGLFGVLLIVWFVWLGISLIKKQRNEEII
ncbi:MAG: DUF4386 family protein [Tenericutes bacterium]|jgi:hypothetical protein|nr:DUF4386 family protein [Mycoplasmatota bacterium]